MIYLKQCRCTFIFLFVIISVSIARSIQFGKKKADAVEDLPPDFMNFVHSLDSMVFKSERKNKTESKMTRYPTKKITNIQPNRRRHDVNMKASQTAAIRDILMLKLVSYYEDKYNVGQTKAFPTPPILEPIPGRRSFNYADSIEKTAQMYDGNKRSSSLRYSENTQDFNALDQNSQAMAPYIDEVVVLR